MTYEMMELLRTRLMRLRNKMSENTNYPIRTLNGNSRTINREDIQGWIDMIPVEPWNGWQTSMWYANQVWTMLK